MKKVFYVIIIVIISGLLYLNYLSYKSPIKSKMISQPKLITITKDDLMRIKLYSNRKTAYTHKNAILDAFLLNEDGMEKLTLTLENIEKREPYKYLKETFDTYIYTFSLPVLDIDLEYLNSSLLLRLKDGSENLFHIGTFRYFHRSTPIIQIETLYGTRYDDFPSLDKLYFKLDEDAFIKTLVFSSSLIVPINKHYPKGELIEVVVPKHKLILEDLAVEVLYEVDHVDYRGILPYYLYYETLENPLDYGILNHVYLFD